jgi:hypothetical protein
MPFISGCIGDIFDSRKLGVPGELEASCSLVVSVSASRRSIGLAALVAASLAPAFAGLLADNGGGWKLVVQPARSSAQNVAGRILMFMLVAFAAAFAFERDGPSEYDECAIQFFLMLSVDFKVVIEL